MRAVKAVGFLGAMVALMLAGCGDGSIKSPDFESVTTLVSVDVQPQTAGQSSIVHVGETASYLAIATFSETVQPGTKDAAGNDINTRTRTENVTASADWTSSNDARASVAKGVVTGKSASSSPVTITATYQGKSDETTVTVSAALLAEVVDMIANVTPDSSGQYVVPVGNSATFQLRGRFNDQQPGDTPRVLPDDAFGVQWASSAPNVASNAASSSAAEFKTTNAGTATITGTITKQPGAATIDDVNPKSASATLVAQAASAFCDREFRAPSAKAVQGPVSIACAGCSVSDPDLAIDDDATTQATMSIPLALLLGASVSFDVSDINNPLVVGKPAGFVISRSADILSAELLSGVSLATLNCDADGLNCDVVEQVNATPNNNALRLALLGLIGNEPQYFLATANPIAQPANGLRLTFQGGLVGLLASLHVQSSCASAVTAVAPTP